VKATEEEKAEITSRFRRIVVGLIIVVVACQIGVTYCNKQLRETPVEEKPYLQVIYESIILALGWVRNLGIVAGIPLGVYNWILYSRAVSLFPFLSIFYLAFGLGTRLHFLALFYLPSALADLLGSRSFPPEEELSLTLSRFRRRWNEGGILVQFIGVELPFLLLASLACRD